MFRQPPPQLPHQPPVRQADSPFVQEWWFLLGREPLLSAAEIFSVLSLGVPDSTAFTYAPPFLRLSCHTDATIMQRLGGTVKMATLLAKGLTENELKTTLTTYCLEREGKITFGMSIYGGQSEQAEVWAKEVKQSLKANSRSARYIASSESVLNSATVFHNKLHTTGIEFNIVPSESGYDVAITRAVQPIEELSSRDFGRPGRDDVSGMLPPKLAMMMLNLAISDLRFSIFDLTILDPFCGSGTILTEAARLGVKKLCGTDVSQKAIDDSTRNVAWTLTSQNLKSKIENLKLIVCDVSHLTEHFTADSVDAIATEPYMGPPLRGRESPDHIKKNCAELAELYITAFAEFKKVLRPESTVVFVIPRFFVGGAVYTISDRIMGKLKEMGFEKQRLLPTSLCEPTYVLYHRPSQHVGREIWKFTLKK